jgi:hypothetical protein
LFEAVKNGHDTAAAFLSNAGANLGLSEFNVSMTKSTMPGMAGLKDAGMLICEVVTHADILLLERLLHFGMSANSGDYNCRTGLHVASR